MKKIWVTEINASNVFQDDKRYFNIQNLIRLFIFHLFSISHLARFNKTTRGSDPRHTHK